MACGPEKFRYHDDLMLDESGKGKGAQQKSSLLLAEVTTSKLYNLVKIPRTYFFSCLAYSI